MRRVTVLAAVFLGLATASCGASDAAARAPASGVRSAVVSVAATPAPTPSASNAAVAFDAVPRTRYLSMWHHPSSVEPAAFAFDARAPDGHGTAPMLVDASRTVDGERWVRILLPIRPNGSAAWARASDVRLVPRDEEIVVDLSRRLLFDYVRGALAHRFRVGVGTPQTPTGVGTFYVWQRVPFANPDQPYGVFALGLSGFSPVLSDWPGGGRMAIHGTPTASDRGHAVSHGCVRVYNPEMRQLVRVPLGTPVIIRP